MKLTHLLLSFSSLISLLSAKKPPTFYRLDLEAVPLRNSDSKYVEHYNDLERNDQLERRDIYKPLVSISNELSFYQATLKIGTPPQELKVIVDTGTQEIWVSAFTNPFCQTKIDCSNGTYDYTKSSTHIFLNLNYTRIYGNLTFVSGQWALDNIEFGGFFLPMSSFVVSERTNAANGVLGLGLYYGAGADSLVVKLFTILKYVQSPIYSLWLNDASSSQSGELLIGAYDPGKYRGQLYSVPLINNYPGIIPTTYPFELCIELSALALSDANGKVLPVMFGSVHAFIDSGTGFSYFPRNVTAAIMNSIGAELQDGKYFVDCKARNGQTALIFDFSGADISIPLAELLIEQEDNNCLVPILSSNSPDRTILGTSFLRGVYIVVDAILLEVSIAESNYNSSVYTPRVEPVDMNHTSTWRGIATAKRAPNYNYFQRFMHPIGNGSYLTFPPLEVMNVKGEFRSNDPPAIYADKSLNKRQNSGAESNNEKGWLIPYLFYMLVGFIITVL